jgi:FG-GAP-like repeat
MIRKQNKARNTKLFLEPLEHRTVPVAGVYFVPTSPPTLPTGMNPDSVDVGDVNSDGRVDIVVANYTSNDVSVFLGNGDGTYQTPVIFSVSPNPSSVIVADFNNDCKLDIATSSFSSNNICVLLNTGTNGANTVSFGAQILSPAGNGIKALAQLDFNGDKNIDLFAVNSKSNSISLLLGKGDGTFQIEQTFAVGTTPVALAIGDLNGDGCLDVVVANQGSNNFSVLLCTSSIPGCVFERQAIYDLGSSPSSIALGDINGDGILDVVATNKGDNNVSLLLGNGDGTFQCQTTISVGTAPCSVALGDLNSDGTLDIVTTNGGSNNISILLGNGNGSFNRQINYASSTMPCFVKLANLNGPCFPQNKLEIIVADYASNDIRILINTALNSNGNPISVPGSGGSGGPNSRINTSPIFAVGPGSSPTSYSTPRIHVYDSSSTNPTTPRADILVFSPEFTGGVVTAIGDINHDGFVDVIAGAGQGGGPHVKVYSGADFTTVLYDFFAFSPSFLGGVTLASADINNDFYDDIIVGAGPGGGPEVRVFSGINGSMIKEFFAFESTFSGGVSVAAGLINSDSFYDIVVGAGAGGGPRVKTYDVSNLNDIKVINDFFAFDPSFLGGIYVSAGNIYGSGVDNIIVGQGAGGQPYVKIFDQNANMLQSFLAYDQGFTGGVRVATGITSSTSTSVDIITGPGIGGSPNVRSFTSSGQPTNLNFLAYNVAFSGGVFVGGRGY